MSSYSLDSIDHAAPLDTVIEPIPSGRQDYDAAQVHREAADNARAEHNNIVALEQYTAAMEAGEPSTSLLTARADCLLALHRPGAALEDCNAALAINPDSAKALKFRGICFAFLGRWIDANADLSASQRIDFNEELEPSRRVAAERAAAAETAERLKRAAEEEAEIVKRKQEQEKRKKEKVLSDFGSQILTKSGNKATSAVLGKSKLIGVYFSAHWCPPCRQFTPILAEIYSTIREEEADLVSGLESDQHALEIVFVSSDKDEKSFQEYYHSQPWTSLPFSERYAAQELSQKFNVSGIPALFILNGEDGSIVDMDGRSTVMNARGDVSKLLKAWKLI